MIFLEIDLKPVGSVLQHRKACLAESPQGYDASRKGTGDLFLSQYLFGFLGMEFDQLARAILHFESRAVGCHAGFAQGIELLDALLLLLVQFVHNCVRLKAMGKGLEGRFIQRLLPSAICHLPFQIGLDEPVQITVHDGGYLAHFVAGPVIFDHLIGLEYI